MSSAKAALESDTQVSNNSICLGLTYLYIEFLIHYDLWFRFWLLKLVGNTESESTQYLQVLQLVSFGNKIVSYILLILGRTIRITF